MADYPDPEEEYELMYAEEMEMMREMEEHYESPRTSKRSLDFFKEKSQAAIEPAVSETAETASLNDSVQNEALERIDSLVDGVAPFTSQRQVVAPVEMQLVIGSEDGPLGYLPSQGGSRKRTVEDLFGDITDMDAEEIDTVLTKRRKQCPDKDTDEDLINKIVAGRKEAHDKINAKRIFSNSQPVNSVAGCGITRRVPTWPFVAIVGGDGDRWYARLRSEEQVDKEINEVGVQGKTIGLLSVSYDTIWSAAQEILEKRLEHGQMETDAQLARALQENHDSGCEVTSEEENEQETTDLWVVKYKPRSYIDLLSEETTNRTLLHWLKLWDKVVFNCERKVRQKSKEDPSKKQDGRFQKKPQAVVNEELDEHGCPQQKLALLCGPPGLGKTTLAHMIAAVAGYKPVEMNASDDRSPEAFRLQLEASTQMRSVMGQQPRPNCLILDEIDGAPAAAIEVLVKFATGKDVGKGRGKKKAAGAGVLKRPIICICNDVYVPALRPLRQLALVVNFPPTASARLAQRLMEIARKERVKTDLTALLALTDKAHNDIRTCLGVLQFFKTRGKEMKAYDVQHSSIGQKDMQKGLFAVWQEIFQIQQPKQKLVGRHLPRSVLETMGCLDSPDMMLGDVSFASRMNNILKTVQSYGDYERLMQGVYENFLSLNTKDCSLRAVCIALEWFEYFDELNKEINTSQSYFLMPYVPYSFVAWHLLFASFAWPKIVYPSVGYEMTVRDTRRRQVVAELMRGMCPSIRSCIQGEQLLLDTLPMMLHILVPNLRPVNIQLYSTREKAELSQVVGIMVEYNLSYIQEKTPEGSYVYKLEPNIEELCSYPGLKPSRVLTYANKQMLSREVELEKMRRAEEKLAAMSISQEPEEMPMKPATPEKRRLPNHLQSLAPKSVAPSKTVQCTDFFGRVVERPNAADAAARTDEIVKSDVWFHFKEGFSNAVRRAVKMRDLV